MAFFEGESGGEGVSADVSSDVTDASGESNIVDVSTDVDAAKDVVADPNASKAEKQEAKQLLKKYKLKVDGREEDFEIDLNNDEEVRKHLQMSKVGNKRMQEKAELEKGMGKFFDLLKADPESVLSHPEIGVDLKEFAQRILDKQSLEDAKTPEQKEIEKYKKELEEFKKAQETDKKAKEESDLKRLEDAQEKQLIGEFKDAFESVKLPYSPRAVKYMAEYMQIAHNENLPLTAAEVAPLVKSQMMRDYQEMLRSAPDEMLEEFIGKENSSRMHKNRVSKTKATPPTASSVQATGNKDESKDKKPVDKQTYRQFFGV